MQFALLALLSSTLALTPAHAQSGDPDFDAFVASTRAPAQSAGVSRETFDKATAGLRPDPTIKAQPARQGEFSLPIHSYLAQVVTAQRVSLGRSRAAALASELSAIERRSGVPASVIVAIWGIETNFGASQGSSDVLRSFATLAVRQHRVDFCRDEFVAALVMLENGDVSRERLVGSWIGAMGQPQFTPSSYIKYAVSYSGRGKPDIWKSSPDALASIGNFLKESGWNPAYPALVEVAIPETFDWKPMDLDFSQWRALGFARADGRPLPASGGASLYLPEGAGGPAFLVTDNWEVVRAYNMSDSYALSVTLLAERIAGRAAPVRAWPKQLATLSLTERATAQKLLMAQGFYKGATDGKVGRASRVAVHDFQIANGMLPADGYLGAEVLKRLRGQ